MSLIKIEDCFLGCMTFINFEKMVLWDEPIISGRHQYEWAIYLFESILELKIIYFEINLVFEFAIKILDGNIS